MKLRPCYNKNPLEKGIKIFKYSLWHQYIFNYDMFLIKTYP